MKFAPLYPVEEPADAPRVRRAEHEFFASGTPENHSIRGLILHRILNRCISDHVGFVLAFDPVRQMYTVSRG